MLINITHFQLELIVIMQEIGPDASGTHLMTSTMASLNPGPNNYIGWCAKRDCEDVANGTIITHSADDTGKRHDIGSNGLFGIRLFDAPIIDAWGILCLDCLKGGSTDDIQTTGFYTFAGQNGAPHAQEIPDFSKKAGTIDQTVSLNEQLKTRGVKNVNKDYNDKEDPFYQFLFGGKVGASLPEQRAWPHQIDYKPLITLASWYVGKIVSQVMV